jgi:hypothetical protein
MNLFKTTYTLVERQERIREALANYNAVPAELKRLIANSDDEVVAKVETATPLAPVEVEPARPLTSEELAKQNGRLVMLQLFGDRASDPYEGLPPALRAMAQANDEREFHKLVAPAIAARNTSAGTIRGGDLEGGRHSVQQGQDRAIHPSGDDCRAPGA